MSEETPVHRRNAPTDKMLKFVDALAARKGLSVPAEARESYDACKAFLDEHGQILPPSEKALAWAQDIAKKKSLPLSAETCADARQLSEWIEANR
ncbi:hypothetical protein [Thiomonas sp.]